MIITEASVKARARNRSRWRVDSSAQWMSSMITTSGPFSLARSKQHGDCLEQLQSDGVISLMRRCGRGRAAAPQAPAVRRRPTPGSARDRAGPTRSRNAPTIGAYGRPSSPMGTH